MVASRVVPLLAVVACACAGCGTTSRDALIAAAEHRLEDARAHQRGHAAGSATSAEGDRADDAAFEVYDAEEHLEAARAARDGRGAGGTADARAAFSRAEQAAVLPR
jgi:hypothetical protein